MKTSLLLFFSFLFLSVQAQHLSESAEISVLTVGPGTHLNDAFGHNAFRIKDFNNKLDVVYGYGEFDFEAPNFYLKFAQGKLNYKIGKTSFDRFYRVYEYYNRTIKEQVLNLSQDQKQRLYDFLIHNYKPENRAYLYEFFFDNCATKIKDVAQIAVNNSIKFNIPEDYMEASFRTLIHENLNRNSWGSFGIDLALGSVIDRKATPEQHMFLPKNIYKFFENATFGSDETPLVKESLLVYEQKPRENSSNFLTSPLFVFGIIGLFILFITYKDYKSQKHTKSLDIIIFSITGITGIVILLLWFATDHTGTHQNYNLLWANALNLIAVFQLFKKEVSSWFVKYLKLLVILLCLLTLHWIIGVQVFAIGLVPLLIGLFVRYLYLIGFLKKY
ncbi:DUF4105 domain-containing protein [Algibacter sp. 2305UL17-15]|uniref:lipoprotein N-acyltransferase Lnb domain-containing protein n=1 Tax=Algibacter sp. 2305UL17-15 TaxID=3231268 RepID=UPI003459C101